MTFVSTIVRDAYRESNLIAISADPTEFEYEEGLRLLSRIVIGVFGTSAGEELQPIIIGRANIQRPQGYPWYEQVPDQTDWYVPQNARLFLNLTSPQTVWLDPNPEDGARFAFIDKADNLASFPLTVNGNGRTINGQLQYVANTDSDNVQFFYREDLGDWTVVDPIALDAEMPFAEEFDDKFIIELAMRLNPRNAAQIAAETAERYKVVNRNFKARYQQITQVGSELGLIQLPSNRNRYYDNTRYGNSAFSSGYAFPYNMRFLG